MVEKGDVFRDELVTYQSFQLIHERHVTHDLESQLRFRRHSSRVTEPKRDGPRDDQRNADARDRCYRQQDQFQRKHCEGSHFLGITSAIIGYDGKIFHLQTPDAVLRCIAWFSAGLGQHRGPQRSTNCSEWKNRKPQRTEQSDNNAVDVLS